ILFNATPTPALYTLSLHDALPISLFAWLEGRADKPDVGSGLLFRPLMLAQALEAADWAALELPQFLAEWKWDGIRVQVAAGNGRSEEHTSELQSLTNLVCRLLLEK